jgi:hypothetical protein
VQYNYLSFPRSLNQLGGFIDGRENTAKDVMYIYNGNEENAEVEFDATGNFPVPIDGSTIRRHGKQWTVARTSMQAVGVEPKMVPTLKIILSDQA